MSERIITDTANATTYVSRAEYEGRKVWVQGERECLHLSIRPVCEVAPDHVICWDCYGLVTDG